MCKLTSKDVAELCTRLNFDLVLNGIILTITGVEVLLAGVRVHSCVVL